jgi:hypothetical protein
VVVKVPKNNAKIIDINTILQAGIDPKTGLPLKFTSEEAANLKENIRKLLRVVDEQDAINRYVWYNLPDGLDGQLIERVLYYKGQGMFFFLEGKFYFLPYALEGTIDVYGRYTGVTPLPFNGKTSVDKDGKEKSWITGLVREPVYDVYLDDVTTDVLETKCVLLHDYCKQISQTVLPRQALHEPLLGVMADCIPFMRTALQNETGTAGMRVNGQDEYSNVLAANKSIKNAALVGDKYAPIVGAVEFQELTTSPVGTANEFMQALESLDNFRLGLYGIENGGLFQKKAHMLGAEQAMAGGATGLVNQDGLSIRQRFCDIVNSIFGVGCSCEISETVLGDTNFDGFGVDEQEQTGIPNEQEDIV